MGITVAATASILEHGLVDVHKNYYPHESYGMRTLQSYEDDI